MPTIQDTELAGLGFRTLVLIRHAKSSWKKPALQDLDRPLSKRGRRDAPFMASILAGHGLVPDLVMSSPATRSRQTAAAMLEAIGVASDRIVRIDSRIYLTGVAGLASVVRDLPPRVTTAWLIGHNPDLSDLARAWQSSLVDDLPTTGIAALSWPESIPWTEVAEVRSELRWHDWPKRHAELRDA